MIVLVRPSHFIRGRGGARGLDTAWARVAIIMILLLELVGCEPFVFCVRQMVGSSFIGILAEGHFLEV